MQKLDALSSFDLGKIVDPETGLETSKDLMFESKNLTTHAVCLGMTGSGKTGLGIVLLEEAGLDKIPAIIIDPKGDLSNLLLTFPGLSTNEFLPWVDPIEAERRGTTLEAYAEETANSWKEGLKKSGGIDRIQKFKDSVDVVVYTPANSSGRPVSILSSFAAPSRELIEDSGTFRDSVLSLTSSLLSLAGIVADPIKSREHILVSLIIESCWKKGQNLDLLQIIELIQNPPFNKVGALDIETFYPIKDRTNLSILLNNLIASPGFKAWMEGEPLEINQLIGTKEEKPKFSIFSIAHLQDSERMFFVTLLLNQLIAWMRQQPGTSNLRVLLYMDEIFGYFPPISTPPSKLPMLTLLKQARAYGLGILLATQNPVDLDYKGLSNCGTWFIGRLQTDRDKMRVAEGLQAASNGNFEAKSLNSMLINLGKRVFIMRSIYEEKPVLFKTRWTLSYLRGPLTLTQIQSLSQPARNKIYSMQQEFLSQNIKPLISPQIQELFKANKEANDSVTYYPRIFGSAKVHFVDAKYKIDQWKEISLIAATDEFGKDALWNEATEIDFSSEAFTNQPPVQATYKDLPKDFLKNKNLSIFEKSLSSYLYQNEIYIIYRVSDYLSEEGEEEIEFRRRVLPYEQDRIKKLQDKIKEKYSEKQKVINKKLLSAQEKLAINQQKSLWQKIEAFLSMLTTLLSTVVGGKVTRGTISQAGTSLKRTGKLTLENKSSQKIEMDVESYKQELEQLENQMQEELSTLRFIRDPSELEIQKIEIHPRKSDIIVEKMALLWWSNQ